MKTHLAAAFGVALLLIVGTGAFTWSSTVDLVDNAHMVDHTHKVLENLEEIVSQLKDADAGIQTTYALKEEVQKSLDVGCTAHVSIPTKKTTLFQTIEEFAKALVS